MKKIIFIIIFILLCSIVSAVPIPKTIFSGDTGIEIQSTILPSYEKNEILYASFHLFNATNGVLLTDASCYALVSDTNGEDFAEVTFSQHLNHYDGNLTALDKIGTYGYTVHCNNTNQGGYISGHFEIKNSILPEDANNSWLVIIIVLCFMTLCFGLSCILIKHKDLQELKALFFF